MSRFIGICGIFCQTPACLIEIKDSVERIGDCRWFTAYSFVFRFNHATDVFSAMLTFPPENQVFALHFCGFENDCYRAETSAAENIVEYLLLRPFGYFLPPSSGLRCERVFGLDRLYHLSLSANNDYTVLYAFYPSLADKQRRITGQLTGGEIFPTVRRNAMFDAFRIFCV